MKKRAGISLVALVITIIVLIILTGAVIMTFMEGGILDRAKEGTFKNDIRAYQEMLTVVKGEDDINKAVEDDYISVFANELKLAEEIQEILPEFKKEYEGIIKVVNGEIVLGDEVETKATDLQKEWLAELGIGNGQLSNGITFRKISEGELAVGSEVETSNGEVFYVIGFSGDNANMIAKYNLGSNGKQDTTGATNPVEFCTEDAWNGAVAVEMIENLNEKESIKADTTSAIYKAIEYGKSLGVRGRLMLYEEAEELETTYSTILYGKHEEGSYLNYWLGSSYGPFSMKCVALVFGEGDNMADTVINNSNVLGVRPVIEVSTSAIK